MKELIKQAENILIVFPDEVNFDMVSAGLGLAFSFPVNKNVDFYFENEPKKSFLNLFDFANFKMINQLSEKEIVVNIKKRDGNIKSVRWSQDEDRIKFIIKPESYSLDLEEVALDVEGGTYDLFVTIGCKSFPEYILKKVEIDEVSIINIDNKEENTQFANINKIKPNSSYSSFVLELIDDNNLSLKKEAIKNLYKGILVVEQGFRSSSEALFSKLENLSSFDRGLFDATTETYDSLTLEQLRYMGKMISNMKVTKDEIIFSLIPYNQIRQTNLNQRIFPELNIVSRLKKFKLIFIISEIQEGMVEVSAYSKKEEIDLFTLFNMYSPEGSPKRVTFRVKETPENMQAQIKDILKLESNEKTNDKRSSDNNDSLEPLGKATNFPRPIAPPPIKAKVAPDKRQNIQASNLNTNNRKLPIQNKFPTESIRPLQSQNRSMRKTG